MGANVLLVLLADQAGELKKKPFLGRDIERAVDEASIANKARIYGGFRVQDHYDSDDYHIAILGGNSACIIRKDRMYALDTDQKRALLPDMEKLAAYLGYDLVKKKDTPKRERSPDFFK